MGRQHKKPVIPVALSPNECAAALGIRPDYVTGAVRRDELKVYPIGTKRRILVIDLIAWVRTWDKRQERIAKAKDAGAPLIQKLLSPQTSERQKQAALRQLVKIEAAWRELL